MGLLFWAIVIACIVIVGAKVGPSASEYMSCIKGVRQAASQSNPDAIRAEFDRYAAADYITTITGQDLNITPGSHGGFTVSFAYDKEIPLAGPVYLLIKYRGSSHSGG
jgi:hypothetical protein